MHLILMLELEHSIYIYDKAFPNVLVTEPVHSLKYWSEVLTEKQPWN